MPQIFKRLMANRPHCPKCGNLLTLHGGRTFQVPEAGKILTVPARYFACRNLRCKDYDKYRYPWRLNPETDQWEPLRLSRGPRVTDFGVAACPNCRATGTLRSEGLFPTTRNHTKRYPRVICRGGGDRPGCGRRFRLIKHGLLDPAPKPGFPPRSDIPVCPEHGVPMKGTSWSRKGIADKVHRYRCQERGCRHSVLLDPTGNPIEGRRKPGPPVTLLCDIPDCHEPRQNQRDLRKRCCRTHGELTDLQRFRLKRRVVTRLVAEGRARGIVGTTRLRRPGLAAAVGAFLQAEMMRLGLSVRGAATKTGLPETTLRHWLTGDVVPMGDDLEPLATIGVDLERLRARLEAGPRTAEVPAGQEEREASAAPRRTCANSACGRPYTPPRHSQKYCGAPCGQAVRNHRYRISPREMRDGKPAQATAAASAAVK